MWTPTGARTSSPQRPAPTVGPSCSTRSRGRATFRRSSRPRQPGPTQYWVTAAAADVDRDAALDIVAVEWEPGRPTQVWRNVGAAGRSLTVAAGVGTQVDAFRAGHLGEPKHLLGTATTGTSTGYAAGPDLAAWLGLGSVDAVDLLLTEPTGDVTRLTDVRADQSMVCTRR